MKSHNLILVFLAVIFSLSSCKNNERESEVSSLEEITSETEDMETNRADEIIEAVESNPELSTFATALNAWNVEDSVETMEGEMIILAPTNMAFSLVRQNSEAGSLVAIEDEELISYHILKTGEEMADLKEEIRTMNDTLKMQTVQGEEIKLSLDGDALVITGATGDSARITDSIQVGGEMVYIIDKVLLPRDVSKEVVITPEG